MRKCPARERQPPAFLRDFITLGGPVREKVLAAKCQQGGIIPDMKLKAQVIYPEL